MKTSPNFLVLCNTFCQVKRKRVTQILFPKKNPSLCSGTTDFDQQKFWLKEAMLMFVSFSKSKLFLTECHLEGDLKLARAATIKPRQKERFVLSFSTGGLYVSHSKCWQTPISTIIQPSISIT